MYCDGLALAMMVLGIITLVRGKFQLTRDKVVYDTPARIVGLLLLIPFPVLISLTVLIGLEVIFHGGVHDPRMDWLYLIFLIASVVLIFGGFGCAIGIANAYGEPSREERARRLRRRRRRRELEEDYNYDDYDYPVRSRYADYDRDRHYDEERDRRYEDDHYREGIRNRSGDRRDDYDRYPAPDEDRGRTRRTYDDDYDDDYYPPRDRR
ncbi:MAG: hypothetical protein ACFCD0_00095 [Gemmataceae bacterium]